MEKRTDFDQITKPDSLIGRVIDSQMLAKQWLHFRNHHQNKRQCRNFDEPSGNQSREKLSNVLTSGSAEIAKKRPKL